MWKFALMTLCGVQAIWAAHYVVGFDFWSLLAVLVIMFDISVLFAVRGRP